MLHSFLNEHFATALLGDDGTEDQKQFLRDVFQSAREGHLCISFEKAPPLPSGLVIEGQDLFPKTPLVRWKDFYYVQRDWVYETHFIEQIKRLESRQEPDFYQLARFQEALAQEKTLSKEQKQAVETMYQKSFSILCGGPGTGKTYTAGVFVKLLLASLDRTRKKNYRIFLAAPTGKAALHLQNSLNAQISFDDQVTCIASTVHRMLKLNPGATQLFSNQPLDADLVFIDEASMMDVSLFSHLLEAIQGDTRLILMGDPNQLPPIEAGNLFSECAKFFGVSLNQCVRTNNPRLQESAIAILEGDQERLLSCIKWRSQFEEDLFDQIYERMYCQLSREPIDPVVWLEKSHSFRALSALRKGPFGVEAINQALLERLKKECRPGMWWAIPIIVTVNCPHLNLFNGSIGVLIGQCQDQIQLSQGIAYFTETEGLPFPKPPPYELSFAISIHKSQGSEFDEVLALFPQGSEHFGREAIYTAATRAKKDWKMVCSKEILSMLLKSKGERRSGISERLFEDRKPS